LAGIRVAHIQYGAKILIDPDPRQDHAPLHPFDSLSVENLET
jgi:hypothetical protein